MAETLFDKLFSRVDRPSEDPNVCWPWIGPTVGCGYGKIWWKGKNLRTHRVAFDECVNDIPDGIAVLHRCDNPPCCRPSHLFLGNDQDNVNDMINKGRAVFVAGEAHGQSWLTEIEVRDIFHLAWKGDLTQPEIGRMFGVGAPAVCEIKLGKAWQHLNLRNWCAPQIMDLIL